MNDMRAHLRPRRRAAGFSFPEVLFAVAVLGIGFIMVAAIFPAAIMQTQAAMEESTGTAVVRNGVTQIGAGRNMRKDQLVPTPKQHVPPTTQVAAPPPSGPPSAYIYSFRDPRAGSTPELVVARAELWNSIRGDLIDSTDPRFASIPMYSREGGANFIRVICVAVRLRNGEKFERDRANPQVGDAPALPLPSAPTTPIPQVELQPIPAAVTLMNNDTGGPDLITIEELTNTETNVNDLVTQSQNVPNAARVGAVVIISDDRGVDDPATQFTNEVGQANGRIYRLGAQVGPNQWELAAGYDMGSNLENLPRTGNKKAIAFVIGAGFASPGTPANGYGGANRAVQVFDNLISLKD